MKLTVRKATAGGPLSPERYEAADAAATPIRFAIAAHLNSNRHISAPQLLTPIPTAAAPDLSLTLFDRPDAESARPTPKPTDPPPGRTRPAPMGRAPPCRKKLNCVLVLNPPRPPRFVPSRGKSRDGNRVGWILPPLKHIIPPRRPECAPAGATT